VISRISVSLTAWFWSDAAKNFDKLVKKIEMPFKNKDLLGLKLSNLASCVRGKLKQFHDDIDHFGFIPLLKHDDIEGNFSDGGINTQKECVSNDTIISSEIPGDSCRDDATVQIPQKNQSLAIIPGNGF